MTENKIAFMRYLPTYLLTYFKVTQVGKPVLKALDVVRRQGPFFIFHFLLFIYFKIDRFDNLHLPYNSKLNKNKNKNKNKKKVSSEKQSLFPSVVYIHTYKLVLRL